ncbi:plasmid mobilization relaxosome protein MobC [Streptomyces sp. SP17BM10]|uniref:plasmid mobilization relaxosome protein MobC n=1 Tax=Streptomyces sp. SP17BM10 TaxID=3002530 RepID=UPI002E7AA384|nr:plasmid mobilization relaxosome protein MobC [Streptomyces sp. SP17BM10]MEE1786882.1 plasmid mobilization relaxosome protein MobC [Streptomyces sp. SP17BM10]
MAEEARREGAPGQAVALGPDELDALQLDILARARADQNAAPTPAATDDESVRAARAAFLHENTAALDVPKLNAPDGAQPMPTGKIRKPTGTRRTERVGPVGFTEAELIELKDAAERHGYKDTISGYLGDIALAFIRGEFTVDLPLHTDRLALQEFRAEIRAEINAIGNNINQMVHVLHRDDRLEPDSRDRLIRLENLLLAIAEALLIPTTHHTPEGDIAA